MYQSWRKPKIDWFNIVVLVMTIGMWLGIIYRVNLYL